MRYQFGKFVKEPTRHIAFPPAETVFAVNVRSNARCMAPLLTVDLAEIDPAWSGVAHFVYFDSPLYLEFALKDGKYKLRRAFDLTTNEAGVRVVDEESVTREREDIFEQEEPLRLRPRKTLKGRGHVALSAFDMDAIPAHGAAGLSPFEWLEKATAQLRATDPELVELAPDAPADAIPADADGLMFAGRPWWKHGDDTYRTPTEPDGTPMAFVGQVRVERFTADARVATVYMFHSPRRSVVTLLTL